MSRILIATDAWHPQVNGVVRTLDATVRTLRQFSHEVEVIEPRGFYSLAVPFYPEIRLSLPSPSRVEQRLRRFRPEYVHLATEGPLGWLVRRACRRRHWQFTTSYHTRFPEYLAQFARVPGSFTYRMLRRFHEPSSAMLVSTSSLETELKAKGFTAPMKRWSRGVDLELFHPRPKTEGGFPRPILLNVGRISREKGLEEFLKLKTPGTKVIVGDGPAKDELEMKYPQARFLGLRGGEELARLYANADLFVFPSRTDTFGIVLIEALASGVPVAAHPVTGPVDIVVNDKLGCLDHDLKCAIEKALVAGDPAACAAAGKRYTWVECTRQFVSQLVPVKG